MFTPTANDGSELKNKGRFVSKVFACISSLQSLSHLNGAFTTASAVNAVFN